MLRKSMSVLLMFGILSGNLLADTLILEGISPSDDTNQPSRGTTKAEVMAKFGEPATKTAAVGEPPISRWEYSPFVVYFENDYVLHAVAKR